MNKKGFAISGLIYSILIIFLFLIFSILSVLGSKKMMLDKLKSDIIKELNKEEVVDNRDLSGANAPVLLNNMVPVVYDGTNWEYADINKQWYNYTKQEWANAIVLKKGIIKNVGDIINTSDIDLWYVWVPRYKYKKIEHKLDSNDIAIPEEIELKFENDKTSTGTFYCEDSISGKAAARSEKCYKIVAGKVDKTSEYEPTVNDWYTHPAFTFGKGTPEAQELSGIWVGKFELGTNKEKAAIDNLVIGPGYNSLVNTTLNSFFTKIQELSTKYNINGDSHMIKNMEWGAITYLSQSKYGKGITDIKSNTTQITGGGINDAYKNNIKQTTTQNIYGIYDMSGGSNEYMMSTVASKNGIYYKSSANINKRPHAKYHDLYSHNENATNFYSGKYGDATRETHGWYKDTRDFPGGTSPWFTRGGAYGSGDTIAGLFFFYKALGIAAPSATTRAILVPIA